MRILTYKRTHPGDPDISGRFGINDCMGVVRARYFDAVIGIGGVGAEPVSEKLAGKLNWVGVGPRKYHDQDGLLIVEFEHFAVFEAHGPQLQAFAPNLARRMYEGAVRVLLEGYSEDERQDAENIVSWLLEMSACGATSESAEARVLAEAQEAYRESLKGERGKCGKTGCGRNVVCL